MGLDFRSGRNYNYAPYMVTADKPRTRGPKSPFGPKSLPNRSHSLTPLSKKILDGNVKRTGESESNIVDLIVRLVGGPGLDDLIVAVRRDAESAGA